MSLVNCEYTLTQTRPYSCRVNDYKHQRDKWSDSNLQALATIKLGTCGDPYLAAIRFFPPSVLDVDPETKFSKGEGSADLELRWQRYYNGIDHSRRYNSQWLRAVASMLSAIADQMDLLPTADQVEATMIRNKLDN